MKIGLCCIAKMENEYIREFVEYYKKLGVDHIFLYDNNDDRPHDGYTQIVHSSAVEEHFEDVIGDYIDSNFVEVINFRNKKICQLEAYQDCYDKNSIYYDWIMFFDCDEFFTIDEREHETLRTFLNLNRFSNYPIIHTNMCIYDDNNLLEPDGRGVVERFTHRAEGKYASYNNGVKSIIRGGLTEIQWISTPHTPISPYKACDCLGNQVDANSPFNTPNTDGAYLRHYKCKTITEYIINKMGKGSYPDQSDASAMSKLTVEDFFKHNIRTKEKEEVAEKLIKQLAKEKDLYIEAHIICFNEVKIAPFAMQYWKRNFNHIYIYDNGSTDGTIELLKTMPNVTVYHFETNGEFNDTVNIQIKNNCWKNSKADFVVVCDFDEFIYSNNLRDELVYMREHKCTIARLNGYEMVCDKFPEYDENKLTIETIQMGSLNEMMCKPILFSPKAIKATNFCCGAHYCNPVGEVKWYDGNKIFLLHHKFLSLDYMSHRYEYLQKRLSQTNIKANMGMQYFWDITKKRKEFNFIKDTAINVWEYVHSDIQKATKSICVVNISKNFTHMLYQLINGMGYAESVGKDFYAVTNANTKEDYELFNEFKSTVFKNIRCVDNILLLPPRAYESIRDWNEEKVFKDNDNIIIFNDDEELYYTPKQLQKRLNFTDNMYEKVTSLYNFIDFDNTIAVYIKRNEYPKDIKALVEDKTRTKSILFLSDDIDWVKQFFKGENIYYMDRQIEGMNDDLLRFLLMLLCKEIQISVYKNTFITNYIKRQKED